MYRTQPEVKAVRITKQLTLDEVKEILVAHFRNQDPKDPPGDAEVRLILSDRPGWSISIYWEVRSSSEDLKHWR